MYSISSFHLTFPFSNPYQVQWWGTVRHILIGLNTRQFLHSGFQLATVNKGFTWVLPHYDSDVQYTISQDTSPRVQRVRVAECYSHLCWFLSGCCSTHPSPSLSLYCHVPSRRANLLLQHFLVYSILTFLRSFWFCVCTIYDIYKMLLPKVPNLVW